MATEKYPHFNRINVSEETWGKLDKIREETGIPINRQIELMLERGI